MAIIRGILYPDVEVTPDMVSVGDSPFYYKDGKWYCKDTGKEAVVSSLEEFLKGKE